MNLDYRIKYNVSQEGIILAGGVWERGQKVAWVPLERPGIPLLEVIGTLEEPRCCYLSSSSLFGKLQLPKTLVQYAAAISFKGY